MRDKTLKFKKVVVRLVSLEYCEDNFYIRYDEGVIYLNEDDYQRNKLEPVDAYMELDECGTLLKTDLGTATYDLGDFTEAIYNIEDNPEYFV